MHDDQLLHPTTLRRMLRFGALLPTSVSSVVWLALGDLWLFAGTFALFLVFTLTDLWVGRHPRHTAVVVSVLAFVVILGLIPLYGGLRGSMMVALLSPVLVASTALNPWVGRTVLGSSILAVASAYLAQREGLSFASVDTDEARVGVLLAVLVTSSWLASQSLRRQKSLAEHAREQEARAREALAARNGELARRKQVEQKLQQALQQAEEASRAKSDFLASMSHELRTPLNAIIGYSEMLGEEVEAADHVEDLGRIERSGRHLLSLINDVLDLSKVEAGRMELHPEEVALDGLLADVVGHVRPLMEASGNTFVVHDVCTERTLVADRLRVKQVLLNLLSNAAKFTRGGTVKLVVRSEEQDGRDVMVFAVRDSGVGIAPDQMARLFRPFVQAEAAPGSRKGGTGLGLVLSRRFAEMMEGSVEADSQPGLGSTFTFTVPTRAAEAYLDDWMARRLRKAAHTDRPIALCVSVHAAHLDVLDRRLAQEGYLAVPCRDGGRALEMLRSLRPAVVFADAAGTVDGRQLLWRMREDASLDEVGLVLCSADGSLTLPAVPKVASLSKPVQVAGLRGALRFLDGEVALRAG